MTQPKVYLVGSLRNRHIVAVTNALEQAGCNVFSDWFAAGPEADDHWQTYEKARGRNYRQALSSPAAQNVWAFDVRHILAADVVVLVMPAGKSGHLELGFAAGRGKPTFILMDEPGKKDRWDVMSLFAGMPIDDDQIGAYRQPGVCYHLGEVVAGINYYFERTILDSSPDNPKVKH